MSVLGDVYMHWNKRAVQKSQPASWEIMGDQAETELVGDCHRIEVARCYIGDLSFVLNGCGHAVHSSLAVFIVLCERHI